MVKIIAEVGNTHEGSVGLAKCMIDAAVGSGADIVKLQTHIFDAESLPTAPNPPYFDGESRKDYFERTAFSRSQYIELIEFTKNLGAELISSPFSVEAVEFLQDLGMATLKIPSGEVSNVLLLEAVANCNVNVILSSGMSSYDELDLAVKILKLGRINSLTVLQCTSEYPCPPENVGLEKIGEFKDRYDVNSGLSDHTLSEAIPAIAVYAGAQIIEKHFTLSKLAYGSDAKNSLEPVEFKRMTQYIREAEAIVSSPVKKSVNREYILNMKRVFEKSLVFKSDLPSGHVLTTDDFAAKKPGDGLPTRYYKEFIGLSLKNKVFKDQYVSEEDV